MAKTIIDLRKMTPEAIKKHVMSICMVHPITIYPLFGAVGLVAFWLLFGLGSFPLILAILAMFVGAGWFSYNYFGRYAFHRNAYFVKLRSESEAESKAKLKMISEFLGDRDFEQGSSQVQKLQDKMKGFIDVLDAKFEEGEMSYIRYLGVAELVQNKALENLEQVVVELKVIDNIDPDYIDRRWAELEKVQEMFEGLDEDQMEEARSLEARIDLYDQHIKNAENLLSLNERAMTELDEITSKLAGANTDGSDVEAELKKAVDKLDALGDETEERWAS